MKKNHKAEFIKQYGQEMWQLAISYWNGNRSPEATEAHKLYKQITQGLTQETYTIYSISENGRIVYIGKTGTHLNIRWNDHKCRARSLNKGAGALHYAMNSVSTNHKLFPEYIIQTISTTADENAADALEKALIQAYQTNITGYNTIIGGGRNTKKFLTRPSKPQNDITRPDQSL